MHFSLKLWKYGRSI